MGTLSEYSELDAVELAGLVRRGEVKPEELLESAIAQAEAHNPRLNAIVHEMFDEGRQVAKTVDTSAPLAGVPFLLKDLLAAYAGVPTTSSARAEVGYVPSRDTELVARYKKAGLVTFGRTNTPEYGVRAVTESILRGPARNPWNTEHTTGGSSGGSAAAIACGIVPLAHGGDGGGSIRVPASCCGLFGLKPTRGRLPMGPDIGESWNGLVLEHVITRSVRDSATVLDLTEGADVGAPYVAPTKARDFAQEVGADPGKLKVALIEDNIFGNRTHGDCIAALRDAGTLLESLGHEVEVETLPIDKRATVYAFIHLFAADVAATIDRMGTALGKKPRSGGYEADTWLIRTIGHSLSAAELQEAIHQARVVGRQLAHLMQTYDLVVTPTLAAPPTRVGELAMKPIEVFASRVIAAVPFKPALNLIVDALANQVFDKTGNTMLFNMTGQPAMSVPLYWNKDGLPIGTQIIGRFGDEGLLFRVAGQLEAARPWKDRRPPNG